ncbi:hypothetical protein LOTGIDRAFT_73997, partial [Lottia gigantea]
IFLKESTVFISVKNRIETPASHVIEAVREVCGDDAILSCIPKNDDTYEVSLTDIESAKKLVNDDFFIADEPVSVQHVSSKIKVVSFMHLSGLISDEEIEAKLKLWRVELIGPIKRRRYVNDGVYDGTRFMRVKFPSDVSSLPYSVGFQTESGVDYYNVRHDHQEKVCYYCLSPGHIAVKCPERVCRRCQKNGQIQRYCPVLSCDSCTNSFPNCEC